MGLDMLPIGKPKKGAEELFHALFIFLRKTNQTEWVLPDELGGLIFTSRVELLAEWYKLQISAYETIKAPQVGRDASANQWVKEKYEQSSKLDTVEEFMKRYEGFYVAELATELDGVPVYISSDGGGIGFRGEFLNDCMDLVEDDLLYEAWETKNATDTLDFGRRMMETADQLAKVHGLAYLKAQRLPTENNRESIESQLHIIYTLAKWLIFYGERGHGYEANF